MSGCAMTTFEHFFADLYMECPNWHLIAGLTTIIHFVSLLSITVLINIFVIVLIFNKKKHALWPFPIATLCVAPLVYIFTQGSEYYSLTSWVYYANALIAGAALLMILLPKRKIACFVIPIGAVSFVGFIWFTIQCLSLPTYQTYSDYMKSAFLGTGLSIYEFGFILWIVCALTCLTLAGIGVVYAILSWTKRYKIHITKVM